MFDCVVLAGGAGRRLGGVDKGALVVDGVSLLDRVLAATAGARRTVVVGTERPTVRPVEWTREEPPGGGPVAGLAAGLGRLDGEPPRAPADQSAPGAGSADGPPRGTAGTLPVVVLATDLARITAPDVDRLLQALARDAVLFVDGEGHRQPLAAAYRPGPLRAALQALEPVSGRAVRELVSRLDVSTLADGGAAADVDTPEDLRDAVTHNDGHE